LNRSFDVSGLAPLQNLPKIVAVFLLIFERKHERFAVGGEERVKSFIEFNFLPIDVMLKKWTTFFFSRTGSN
jgi:hypothetical protein